MLKIYAMDFEQETYFQCPYCGQQISMLLEELYGQQTYIEDCEVCCSPIQITFEVDEGEIVILKVEKAQ